MTVDELKFDEKDCLIEGPVNQSNASKPFREGIPNGQGFLDENSARKVIVRHLPTGISAEENRYSLRRNKEIALSKVRKLVEDLIQQVKDKQQ